MIFDNHTVPSPNHPINVVVNDGCIATVPSLSICECCLLINLTFVLTSLFTDKDLNSYALTKVNLRIIHNRHVETNCPLSL
jgi:hypothetical protein